MCIVSATIRRREIKILLCLSAPVNKSLMKLVTTMGARENTFFYFRPVMTLLGEFGPKYQNCQIKLKFGT